MRDEQKRHREDGEYRTPPMYEMELNKVSSILRVEEHAVII